ncbi:Outer membrane protein beta-barrel domain-containing protein [Flavobacterium resistens]|uniref:Outer membrane beta-barrel protein n=1 Tax=Flavobacterium resistens TaxID=443612 RepID=A0A521CID5_9FLAO|nr:outer membrane beta-barrel protein [Flavobacterium resistens]MRX66667.1 outer membrane beta-barrel protein [Flavobacterium resistens]SMO59253.1 Outer membrane protein beta-barrel domain-containing protein [Flavobacterium resistens]
MKKILVIVALAMFSFANAQKGSVLVMGSVGYNSQKRSNIPAENKYYNFSFSPKIGYQFHENWIAGIESSVNSTEDKIVSTYSSKINSFRIGGFLRYTKTLNQTFSAYADFGAGYQNTKSVYSNNPLPTNTINKGNGFYVGVTPAIFINVHKGFGLNFNIGGIDYGVIDYDGGSGATTAKSFNVTFGQSVSIGISKNF